MEYIKIRLGDEFDKIGSRFEETIEDMFRSMGPIFCLTERTWKPSIDLYETANEIVILAEVAGVSKDCLDIEVNSKAIKISGNRNEPPKRESCKYRLAEIQYGIFERILILPAFIDPDKVDASFQDGFLKIRLLKKPMEKTIKIPIADD
jgi:HSP20 family protein